MNSDTGAFPEWLVPMAATLTQERFTGPEWIFERKFDGIRLLAFKRQGEVQLFSRNRLPQHIPTLARSIADLPVRNLILDGEVTWDRTGGYHVFDILWIDDRNVTALPLEERRALLGKLPLTPPLYRVTDVESPKHRHVEMKTWDAPRCGPSSRPLPTPTTRSLPCGCSPS